MKYNLKNRPKEWISVLENGGYSKHYIKTEKWFEEFQKELQEIMPSYERATINPYDNEKRRIIKEILGE